MPLFFIMKTYIEKSIANFNGKSIDRYTLTNKLGTEVSILNLGGIISSFKVPTQDGKITDIVLGFEDVNMYNCEEYLSNYPYFGAICGRVANRIKNGRFTLDGVEYILERNNNGSHLHGGAEGFDKKIWQVEIIENKDNTTLELSYTSVDGEEFYPGNLQVTVKYSLFEDNKFTIDYEATTDKTTPVNLTNHTYFNLTGKKDISTMRIKVNSSEYTPLNELLVPTGEIESTNKKHNHLDDETTFEAGFKNLPQGYDYNYILHTKDFLNDVGYIKDTEKDIMVKIHTTQPAVQVYSGYYIPEVGGKFGKFSGVALETQHFPDAVNNPHFPSVILNPGEKYRQTTIWNVYSPIPQEE